MTQENVTYQDKLTALRLDLNHPNSKNKVFVLVEGDSDIRIFRKIFDKCKVECVPGGSSKVEAIVPELLPMSPLIIGIRDADFMHLNTPNYALKNIFLTDYHDIEMSIIAQNGIMNAILAEYIPSKIQKCDEVRHLIFEVLQELSLLKYTNTNDGRGIKFDACSFQDLIDFVEKSIKFEEYYTRILSKNKDISMDSEENTLAKIRSLKKENLNYFQLCNGHDFIKTLAQYIRTYGNTKNITDATLSSILRINYSFSYFEQTNLYKNTKKWADAQPCEIYTDA
jgi:hypothetical protein